MISKSSSTLLFSFISAAAALDCTGNDALLQVKYNLTEDVWNSTRPSNTYALPFLLLHDNEQQQERAEYGIEYSNFTDLVDFEKCLPRDECSTVVVAGLPASTYDLIFDGEHVEISAEFHYEEKNPVTSTDVGTCIKHPPTCQDTEALVEVQFWSGQFSYRNNEFRIEDDHGDIILNGGSTSQEYSSVIYSLNSTYACVARENSCYTFLIGSGFEWNQGYSLPAYSLFFDGSLVHTNDSFQFDSAQFGDSCQPLCNQDNESLVDLFLYDDTDNIEEYRYKWDLNLLGDESSTPFTSGEVPMGGLNKSPLYHKTICTPKQSCSSFNISAPLASGLSMPIYSLAMDDTIYREIQWHFSWGQIQNNQTTIMGSCTVNGLCDEQAQDLFDLELHTPEEFKFWDGRSSYKIPYGNITWNFDYSDDSKRVPPILRSDALLSASQYISTAYKTGSSYRTIECVPKSKGNCDFSFNMTADSAVESYAVKKNGVQLVNTQGVEGLIWKNHDSFMTKLLMTPFGQSCSPPNPSKRSLSAGAIAGIVIACLLVFCLLIGVIIMCLKRSRREEQHNQRDEEDPLRETLL